MFSRITVVLILNCSGRIITVLVAFKNVEATLRFFYSNPRVSFEMATLHGAKFAEGRGNSSSEERCLHQHGNVASEITSVAEAPGWRRTHVTVEVGSA